MVSQLSIFFLSLTSFALNAVDIGNSETYLFFIFYEYWLVISTINIIFLFVDQFVSQVYGNSLVIHFNGSQHKN